MFELNQQLDVATLDRENSRFFAGLGLTPDASTGEFSTYSGTVRRSTSFPLVAGIRSDIMVEMTGVDDTDLATVRRMVFALLRGMPSKEFVSQAAQTRAA